MISMSELNSKGYPIDSSTAANLKELLTKMNAVRSIYGKAMTITSGLRSAADQMRINPSAPKSKHMTGQACDVYDPDGKLWAWILANMAKMEVLGLWFEDKGSTPTWVHFQCVPPKSGKRIFLP